MAQTVIGVNDAKAVRKYSGLLAVDTVRKSYFNRKFMGVGEDAETPIQTLVDLETDAGDTINYDLVMQLKMAPIEGDNVLEGREEDLKMYSDSVKINQLRGGVNTGGRMTRKRTLHDLRAVAKKRQSDWWARVFDELFFMYLSGSRGVNADYVFPLSYQGQVDDEGHVLNPFVVGDALHTLYGGAAKSKATVTASDTFDLTLLERAVARANTMGGGSDGVPSMVPCMVEGEEKYIAVLHPWQVFDLRTNAGAGQWVDIQKAAATAEGRNSPLFKGGLGQYNNVILHEHRSVIRHKDFGADQNVNAGAALFLGRQAAVCAFGSRGSGLRFDWTEETADRGNQVVITTAAIVGVKKTAYTIDGVSRDFGVMTLNTSIKDPS